jgi:ketosteroid isomerase-like protein
VLDWIDAMRIGDPDRFGDRLASDAVWWDVSGQPACRGRGEVLEWLRASVASPRERAVEALELIATQDHAVLGIRDPEYRELAGLPLEGQLFVVFAVRDGEVVELRDYARRDEALRAAGVADRATWR